MDTDDLNVDTLTWPSFDATADPRGNAPEPPPAEEVTPPPAPHAPAFSYADFKTSYRTGAVPEALRPFMMEAEAQGYTPPFYVNRAGTTRAAHAVIPGCPPIEPGGKALVFDDWGNPRVIEVTGMHDGEIRGMLGTTPVQCRAWIAMSPQAPLTVLPETERPNRLTAEEADALDAEFFEWSKYLGWRAEKYGWCNTFERILQNLGIKPWRPGFKSVTLSVDVLIDAKDVALTEKIGGEAEVRQVRATTLITLKDVSREDYENGRWSALLQGAGYKNLTGNIGVFSKEAVTL